MKHDITIFDGIVKTEPNFTQLFYSFLRFKPFRYAFLDLIKFNFNKRKINFENFETEFNTGKFGRPDIALLSDETEILFEIKSWYNRNLTENQPEGYYKYLTESSAKYKALILICPEDYEHLDEYKKRLEHIKSKSNKIHTETIIYWKDIAKLIKRKEFDLLSPLFAEYIHFIYDWFQLTPIFLNPLNITTMFGKEYPESLKKTIEIINIQYSEFEKSDYKIRWTKKKCFEEYGFYLTLTENDDELFFGIWFDYWENSGNPICVALDSENDKIIKLFNTGIKKNNLNPAIDFNEWKVTYFDKQYLSDDESKKIISNKIRNIIFEINN